MPYFRGCGFLSGRGADFGVENGHLPHNLVRFSPALAAIRTLGGRNDFEKGNARIMMNPVEYTRQVKTEMKKVTWPTRKETTVSGIAVLIMVTITAIFLFLADQIIAFAVRMILGFGG